VDAATRAVAIAGSKRGQWAAYREGRKASPGAALRRFEGPQVVGKEIPMSVVQHGVASRPEADFEVPEFPVGLRGYDRQQVDVFLKDLTVRVSAERRRAEQAERAAAQMRAELAGLRNQPPPSFEHLGAEAARILEQAGHSAKLLVEEARSRGQVLVEEAEAQATELIERAEQRSAELEAEATETLAEATREQERILSEASLAVEEARQQAEEDVRAALDRARDEAERTRQRALSEQAAMQAETDRLRESRGRMLEYLGRIHTDLGDLLAEATQPAGAGAEPAESLEEEEEEPATPNGDHPGVTPLGG
jgi:cell division septum initiation protein DivIVA